MTYFISGHLDLTDDEFSQHYITKIDKALNLNGSFVIGDARGADSLAQQYLLGKTNKVVVYHMFESPRFNIGYPTKGGYLSDEKRDSRMTNESNQDIAWVRTGRGKSGTQKNIDRRERKPQ